MICRQIGRMVVATCLALPASGLAMGRRPAPVTTVEGVLYQRADLVPGVRFEAEPSGRARLSTASAAVLLEPESRKVLVNGISLWLHEPVRAIRGAPYLADVDVESSLLPILRPLEALRSAGAALIVLDPGHGGDDTGARGTRASLEKDLALDVCVRVRNLLRAHGIESRLTREEDRFIELPARAAQARAWSADLFVSVHFNAAGNPDASGAEIFALTAPGFQSTRDAGAPDPDPTRYPGQDALPASLVLAQRIQRHLLDATGAEDRGIRRARFVVLRESVCPSALVECGFLSNPAEEERILTRAYRQGIAEGIGLGIIDYVRAVHLARAREE